MALTIGELARTAEVGRETVRFYERVGLIEDPPRTRGGYRIYPAKAVARLQFIKRAKELGFSLKEIRSLLTLRVSPGTNCDEVRRLGQERIEDIEARIRDLASVKAALAKLVESCGQRDPTEECPLLEALACEEEHEARH
ncbi:MAG TPA: MerR family DNA-binding protein [Acidobacteriota bacterium]|nr:MerR family DNA-binding protein [Acidobacteriota bacterium]